MSLSGRERVKKLKRSEVSRDGAKKSETLSETEKKPVAVKLSRFAMTRDDRRKLLIQIGAGLVALIVLAGVVLGYNDLF